MPIKYLYIQTGAQLLGCNKQVLPTNLNSPAILFKKPEYLGPITDIINTKQFIIQKNNIKQEAKGTRRYRYNAPADKFDLITEAIIPGGTRLTGKYGTVNTNQLEEAFLGGLLSGRDEKLFSIVDCNSFHHMSYILAKYAFQNFATGPQDRPVVINFDQHDDVSGGKDIIRCDSWANWLLRDATIEPTYIVIGLPNTLGDFGRVYSVFETWIDLCGPFAKYATHEEWNGRFPMGNKVMTQNADFIKKPNQHAKIFLDGPYIKKVLTTAFRHAGIQPANAKIYITVDRDVIRGNCTSWGDKKSSLSSHEAIMMVTNAILLLKKQKSEIVGFDVIGLPEQRAYPGQLNFTNLSEEQVWQQTRKELESFHTALHR